MTRSILSTKCRSSEKGKRMEKDVDARKVSELFRPTLNARFVTSTVSCKTHCFQNMSSSSIDVLICPVRIYPCQDLSFQNIRISGYVFAGYIHFRMCLFTYQKFFESHVSILLGFEAALALIFSAREAALLRRRHQTALGSGHAKNT